MDLGKEVIINQKVRFKISNSTLSSVSSSEEEVIKLDNLESVVLCLLVKYVNQLVTYHLFLSQWKSSEATENSLSRVISLLRKKLKKAGLNEQVIINTSKKGYTLVADIETLSSLNLNKNYLSITSYSIKAVTTQLVNSTTPLKVAAILFISLSIVLSLSLFNSNTEKEGDISLDTPSRYTQLVSNTDIKVELSYNNDTDKILYSAQSFKRGRWHIQVLDRYSGNTLSLKDANMNLNKPTWISRHEFIYRSSNETSCEIRKAFISNTHQDIESIKLFPCNPNSYASALAKFGENQILIADAEFNNTASNIFLGDLQTGLIKKIKIDHEGGAGFYNIITTDNSELVALLSSRDGIDFKIQLVDPTTNWSTVWNQELKANNFSVGWDGSILSFRNDNAGITVVNFHKQKELRRTNIPVLSPIYNISSSNHGLIMTSGEFIAQELIVHNSQSDETINVTHPSSAKNKLAQFYKEDKVLFISNKTGNNQIWVFNLSTKQLKQISSFSSNKNIRALSVEPTKQVIALQVENKVELYKLNDNLMLSKMFDSVKGINPTFFSEQLLLTQYDGTNSNIFAFTLKNLEETRMLIEDAYYSAVIDNALLYSKKQLPGIWKYESNNRDPLVCDLPSSSYRWFVTENTIYYQNDMGEYFNCYITNSSKVPFNSNGCNKPLAVSGKFCLSKELTPSVSNIVLLEW